VAYFSVFSNGLDSLRKSIHSLSRDNYFSGSTLVEVRSYRIELSSDIFHNLNIRDRNVTPAIKMFYLMSYSFNDTVSTIHVICSESRNRTMDDK
jgi:hypothetical protein